MAASPADETKSGAVKASSVDASAGRPGQIPVPIPAPVFTSSLFDSSNAGVPIVRAEDLVAIRLELRPPRGRRQAAARGPRPQQQARRHGQRRQSAATFVPREGSIPRLRFGQMRARVVDMAGNGLGLDDRSLGATENATNPVGYWRFEPVHSPVLVHRSHVSEGESLERMVIRSNHDADPAGYLTSAAFAAAITLPGSRDFEYGAVNERHLVPPKSSQAQCEQHGMFNPLFGSPQTIKQGYAIAAREIGSLYDMLPGTQVELVTPHGVSASAATGALPPALPSPENPVGGRLAGGQYVIHRERRLPTPYLPDAAAGGVAILAAPGHTLPGVTGQMVLGPSAAVVLSPSQNLVLVVAQADKWPQSGRPRIRLAERKAALVEQSCAETFADAGTPVWDEAQRELTLFVAKGRIVRLRYASFVHKGFLASFGLPQWVAVGAERAFVLGTAQLGCHWMMTPFRPLTLVPMPQYSTWREGNNRPFPHRYCYVCGWIGS